MRDLIGFRSMNMRSMNAREICLRSRNEFTYRIETDKNSMRSMQNDVQRLVPYIVQGMSYANFKSTRVFGVSFVRRMKMRMKTFTMHARWERMHRPMLESSSNDKEIRIGSLWRSQWRRESHPDCHNIMNNSQLRNFSISMSFFIMNMRFLCHV